jgi:hypothetical protein
MHLDIILLIIPPAPKSFMSSTNPCSRSQWPRGLRCRSTTARLLRLLVWIPPGALMIVCFVCCVLSRRGLRVALITWPEESYRLWCVVVFDLDTPWMRRPWPTGAVAPKILTVLFIHVLSVYVIRDTRPSYRPDANLSHYNTGSLLADIIFPSPFLLLYLSINP